jgi:hypothetical protein
MRGGKTKRVLAHKIRSLFSIKAFADFLPNFTTIIIKTPLTDQQRWRAHFLKRNCSKLWFCSLDDSRLSLI